MPEPGAFDPPADLRALADEWGKAARTEIDHVKRRIAAAAGEERDRGDEMSEYRKIGGACGRGHIWVIGDDAEMACGSKSWDLYVRLDDPGSADSDFAEALIDFKFASKWEPDS